MRQFNPLKKIPEFLIGDLEYFLDSPAGPLAITPYKSPTESTFFQLSFFLTRSEIFKQIPNGSYFCLTIIRAIFIHSIESIAKKFGFIHQTIFEISNSLFHTIQTILFIRLLDFRTCVPTGNFLRRIFRNGLGKLWTAQLAAIRMVQICQLGK
jgi:hypothetical protein